MRRLFLFSLSLMFSFNSALFSPTSQAASSQPKDWTFLIFLNGNNSLDSFGSLNIKQMEKVGSTDHINIVVQWASLQTRTVTRLLIKKSADGSHVTSPVLQTIKADMGDWNAVVDFVKWGVTNYPASHYFLDIWDHGSGWHDLQKTVRPRDISWDEITGNHITTQQMGLALSASAKVIGHKVDLYASDACMMAMVEVANEVADSVSVYAGSQQTEPGAGWPYDTFLSRWSAKPQATAQEIATLLSEEYAKLYAKSRQAATFSVFDLAFLPALNQTIASLGASLTRMGNENLKLALKAAGKSQYFTDPDYIDLNDFLTNLSAAGVSNLNTDAVNALTVSLKSFVITSNNVRYPKAHGLSIWLPTSNSTLSDYEHLYSQLKFDSETHWSDFLKALNK